MTSHGKVAVLLSSYNGARYIECQIASILRQSLGNDIHLFVRDDGSTDNTVEIVRAIADGDKRVTLLPEANVGATASFMRLLSYAKQELQEFQYFSFSDQDDCWDSDKLEIAVGRLDAEAFSGPLLYGAASHHVDSELRPLEPRAKRKVKPITSFNAMIQCIVPGHTYVFNRALLDALPDGFELDSIYGHDVFLLNVALGCGKFVYDPFPHAEYRLHAQNAMGVEKNVFKWFWSRFNRARHGDSHRYARQIRYLYQLYANKMPVPVRREVERFMNAQDHVLSRLGYALTTRFYRQKPLESLAFRLLYLCGGYTLQGIKETRP